MPNTTDSERERMSGLKRKEEEIGLVDLEADKEQAGQEAADGPLVQQKKAERDKAVRMAFGGIMAGGLLMILLGTYILKIPLITAGFVTVIEAVIAVALNNSHIWVHIGIMALEIVIGIWSGHFLFMALAAAYYFVLLISLKLLEFEE